MQFLGKATLYSANRIVDRKHTAHFPFPFIYALTSCSWQTNLRIIWLTFRFSISGCCIESFCIIIAALGVWQSWDSLGESGRSRDSMGMGRTVGSWSGKVLGKEWINKTYLERGRGETSGKCCWIARSVCKLVGRMLLTKSLRWLEEMCLESVDERQVLWITTDSVSWEMLRVRTTLRQCIWYQAS